MDWKRILTWSSDLKVRHAALDGFADSICGCVKDGTYVWDHGCYLILHFDLMTISPSGPVDRSTVYTEVNNVVDLSGGTRLTESVYLVPLLLGQSSEKCAALFWNTLQLELLHQLLTGDAFYIHFAPDIKNRIGGIAQVIPVGSKSLLLANIPDA